MRDKRHELCASRDQRNPGGSYGKTERRGGENRIGLRKKQKNRSEGHLTQRTVRSEQTSELQQRLPTSNRGRVRVGKREEEGHVTKPWYILSWGRTLPALPGLVRTAKNLGA